MGRQHSHVPNKISSPQHKKKSFKVKMKRAAANSTVDLLVLMVLTA